MRPDDERLMGIALEEAALAAAEGEIPVGACVVRDGVVLGRGHNRREADRDPLGHAEIAAIRAAAAALGSWRWTAVPSMSRWNPARCAPEPS